MNLPILAEALGRNGSTKESIALNLPSACKVRFPKRQDISGETLLTRKLYGLDTPLTKDFGQQCLMARRFAERGVRFVQVTHSDQKVQWDQHGNLRAGHAERAAQVDLPIAGLLSDLKARGMLDDTLVVWGGEFGRTPTVQGPKDGWKGS